MKPRKASQMNLPEKMLDRIMPEPNSGCWLWVGGCDRLGYGKFYSEKSMKCAHRVVYEYVRGPIPSGLELDHLCRVTCCVNPDHLEPVTHQENMKRGFFSETLKTHCPHGHPYNTDNTHINPKGHRVCRTCLRNRARLHRERVRQDINQVHPQ